MKLAVLLLAALPALPQVTATLKPVSVSGAHGAIGSRKVGLWTASITSRYAIPVDLPHERITQSFPLLRDLPNRLAEDLLTRQSSDSFWSVVARWGPPLLTAGVAAYGSYNRIAQGVTLATLLFGRAGQRAPAPSLYFSDFCPEHIMLAAYGAATCFIASGIVPGAAPMTALIDIAGVPQ